MDFPTNDSVFRETGKQVERVKGKLELLGSSSKYSVSPSFQHKATNELTTRRPAPMMKHVEPTEEPESNRQFDKEVLDDQKPLPLKPLLDSVMGSFELLDKDQKKEFVASLLKAI